MDNITSFTLFGEHGITDFLKPHFREALKSAENIAIDRLRERGIESVCAEIAAKYNFTVPTIETGEGSTEVRIGQENVGTKNPLTVVWFYFPYTGNPSFFKCHIGNSFSIPKCTVGGRNNKEVLGVKYSTGYYALPLPEENQKVAKNAGQEIRKQIINTLSAFPPHIKEFQDEMVKRVTTILKSRLDNDDASRAAENNIRF